MLHRAGRLPKLLLLIAAVGAPDAPAQPPRPNIVFVLADDLGWTDLTTANTSGGNGSGYYRTPNIDALAARGMSFDHAYSNGPNCAPTRAALMSGQHAARTGVYTVASSNRGQSQFRRLEGVPNTNELAPSVTTIAEWLRSVGYATAHFGKWHLGLDSAGVGPLSQGFDVNAGGTQAGNVTGGSDGHFAQADGSWLLPGLPANGIAYQFMATRLTDDALHWMANTTGPFFCYVTHFSVHDPVQAPAPDIAAFNGVPKTRFHTHQTYAGMLKNLDDNVGRIVSFLENTPDPRHPGQMLVDNSVIVFYSDNGGVGGYASAGIVGGTEVTHQFPLKSGKGSLYEGGIRVPLIVRWDGRVAPGTVRHVPVQSIDLLPTLAAIGAAALPPGSVDGLDLSRVLTGMSTQLPRDAVFWHFPAYLEASASLGTWRSTPASVVRRGDYKLHFYYETRRWELYDLAADIGEQTNLAGRRPDLVTAMGERLREWLETTDSGLPRFKGTTTPVPLPLGARANGDAVDWQLQATATATTVVQQQAMVAGVGQIWRFGGQTDTGAIDELWRYDGVDWSRLAPATSPPARALHGAAWDVGRSKLVVFGGRAAMGNALSDTWAFDGFGWHCISTGTPAARFGHALVHDVARGRTVMFGGELASGALLDDTWEFDGAVWTQRSPSQSPVARHGHALVHDPSSGVSYLFGGTGAAGALLVDTWRWDGTNWSRLSTASSPSPRAEFAAAWDTARGRLVLWGGRDGDGLPLDDTWIFNGSDWLQRDPLQRPLAGSGAAAAFDATRSRIVVHGGQNGVASNGTWELLAAPPGVARTFGSGCAGTAGVPQLSATSLPNLGQRFDLDVMPVPPGPTPVFAFIGFSNTTWNGISLPASLAALGAPGCALLVSPDLSMQRLSTAGQARLTIPIPLDPGLLTLDFYVQAFVADPAANALQFVVSNGVQATIGGD